MLSCTSCIEYFNAHCGIILKLRITYRIEMSILKNLECKNLEPF